MRFSDTEPSSVILSQTKYYKKLICDTKAKECQIKLKPKGMV